MDLLIITLPKLIVQNMNAHILEGTVIVFGFFMFFLVQLIRTKTLFPGAGGLLITIGICFTFYGISIGLANFNPDEIDESLPQLIAGIKTAFLVSVMGVFFSIILRVADLVIQRIRKQEVVDESAGIEDLVATQKTTLKAIESGFSSMSASFDNFAKTMAENNSKAFIKALEDVIKDFNNKITEQFGDNFKQLNAAVGALLVWQKNYKEYIEVNEKNLNSLYQKIDKAIKDYSVVVEHSTKFAENANAMKAILDALVAQRANLEKNAQSLASFLTNMNGVIPNLVKEMTTFQNSSLKSLAEIQQHSEGLEKHYVSVTTKLTNNINDNIGKLTGSLLQINDNLLKGSETLNSQIKVLDNELESVLKNMGVNLASISGKFVEDYKKIINYLNLKLGPAK